MAVSGEIRALGVGGGIVLAFVASGVAAEVRIHNGSFLPADPVTGHIEVPASVGKLDDANKNLLHTFSVFNVLSAQYDPVPGYDPGGESVTFTGPTTVKNVIARVTGGTSAYTGDSKTLIDGPLTVAIPGANFYLFNPNGVVFGEFGSVQADGSVHISTADKLKLKDGLVINANPSLDTWSTLTSAPPAAFGFLGPNPAKIQMNGPFMYAPVPPGKTFALVGGDIEIRPATFPTEIVAPGSKVHLASVRSAGDAVLRDDGTVDLGDFAELGRVSLGAPTVIDVSEDGPGSIDIRAGELTLSEALLYAQNYGIGEPGRIDIDVRGPIQIRDNSLLDVGGGAAGTVFVRGGEMTLSGSSLLAQTFGDAAGGVVDIDVRGPIQIRDTSFLDVGGGAAGTIFVRGGEMTVSGSYLLAQTFGDAAGGILDIAVAGDLTLETNPDTGFISAIDVVSQNLDPSLPLPAVRLDAGGRLAVTGGSRVVAGTGTLDVRAAQVFLAGNGAEEVPALSTESFTGDSGSINIDAGTVELRDGAQISSSTGGPGDAGDVTVRATESVRIEGDVSGIYSFVGRDPETKQPASGAGGTVTVVTPLLAVDGGLVDSSTIGDGDAGDVNVHVDELQLTGGGQIRSFSGGFDTETGELVAGTGAAGSVTVEATGGVTASGTIETAGGTFPSGLLAETRGEGAGGNVTVAARNLTLTNGATISSSSLGTGLAGDVRIALRDTLRMRNASIATQAVTSDGGNIAVRVGELIDMVDSRITTSVESGEGGGGNIAIEPPEFVVLQRSQIIANAFGGPGGNIDIVAGQLIADPFSVIEASSALGIDGNVNIDAPNPDVGSNLVVLPESFLDAARLLQPNCGAARAGLSSLVEVGRGGLPADPDGYLMSTDGAAAPAARRGAAAGGLPGDVPVLAQVSCAR